MIRWTLYSAGREYNTVLHSEESIEAIRSVLEKYPLLAQASTFEYIQ